MSKHYYYLILKNENSTYSYIKHASIWTDPDGTFRILANDARTKYSKYLKLHEPQPIDVEIYELAEPVKIPKTIDDQRELFGQYTGDTLAGFATLLDQDSPMNDVQIDVEVDVKGRMAAFIVVIEQQPQHLEHPEKRTYDDEEIATLKRHKSGYPQTGPRRFPIIPADVVPRDELCDALYSMLRHPRNNLTRIVQVRGTPASGKSTLLSLFRQYLLQKEQNAHVYSRCGWPAQDSTLTPLYNLVDLDTITNPTYFLLDDAQVTYRNMELWDFFKDGLHGHPLVRVVLFCSYGSGKLVETDVDATPMQFSENEMMTLWKTIPKFTAASHGLLFTRTEYEDLLNRTGILLDDDLVDKIFRISAGHVGAITFLIDQVDIMNNADQTVQIPCSLSTFYAKCPNYLLARKFAEFNTGRGLPKSIELKMDKDVADMFRKMLRDGYIQDDSDVHEAIHRAHKKGWIYFDRDTDHYLMASPLHSTSLSWILDPPSNALVHNNIEELVFDVLSRFKPPQIYLPYRAIGPPSKEVKAHEYTYQAEFYRALHDLTYGGVRLTAEFVSGKDATLPGRLDFVIPAKGWAVELTREGSKIEAHWQWFESGAYREMRDAGIFKDYVLIDCRTTQPTHRHPDISCLYHAVFHFESNTVTILNNALQEVKTCNLLEGHL